jgi:hypothetical protein
MNKLSRDQLMSLEEYAEHRPSFRAQVIAHKKQRFVEIGDAIRLLFEDAKTIQYQIQEMLRIERIFEKAGIEEELDAYNPLIPDGQNLKATMLIEYDEPQHRKVRLAELIGVDKKVYLQIEGFDKVHPISNEDLDRETDEKTSSVHFLRFEFTAEMVDAWIRGETVKVGVEHPHYQAGPDIISKSVQQNLAADFTPQLTH